MSRPTFEPDVTLGDLLVLAKLSSLIHEDGLPNASARLVEDTQSSETRVRNALMRIEAALGPVETEGTGKRRTGKPSLRGRNIGGAAVLADLLITISGDPNTDQNRLFATVEELVQVARQRYKNGHYFSARPKIGF